MMGSSIGKHLPPLPPRPPPPLPSSRSPRPSPPLPPPSPPVNTKHLFATGTSVMFCVLLIGIVCAIIRKYYLERNNVRIGSSSDLPENLNTQSHFGGEDQGSGLDHHPVWYINTVGFPQSVIDSITTVKYKKGEGLIEETNCSICLSEFNEFENLRLLPKCSHAFHVSCIDTWLSSHKNCPLCRAPVIFEDLIRSGQNSNDYNDFTIGNMTENSRNHNGEGSNGEVREWDISEGWNIHEGGNTDNHNNHDRLVIDEDTQPMKRSISLDSFSGVMIYRDGEIQDGILETKINVGSSSVNKLKRSCSMEHKKPIFAMKKSFSFLKRSKRNSVLIPL